MRVYYLVKVLQVLMAVIGIYRLLYVHELCEQRNAESLSSCMLAMRLYLSISSTELNTEASMALRSRRMAPKNEMNDDTMVVMRDPSLEEVHARNLRSGMLPKIKTMQHLESIQETSTDEVETMRNSVAYDTTITEMASTSKNVAISITASSTEKSLNREIGVTKEISTEVTTENSSDSVKTTTSSGPESTESYTQELPYIIHSSKDMVLEKSMHPPTKKIKLANRVQNCLPTGVYNVLGLGENELPYIAAIRLPIICLLLSIVGVMFSIIHVTMNLSKPRRCRVFTESIIQVVLWSLSGIALLLVRQDWQMLWNGSKPGSFIPEYPYNWYCAEISCYAMVIVFLAEFYFYDYIFYKINFEESYGSYTVVERPEYENSIYMSTVEMIDDTAL